MGEADGSEGGAVQSLRAGRETDGNLAPEAPRDTVEVHAYFEKADGFFGLMSYLAYAGDQLKHNFNWLQKAAKIRGSQHLIILRRISTTPMSRPRGF